MIAATFLALGDAECCTKMQEELQALGCVAREIVVDHNAEGRRRSAMSGAAAVAAAPYWRNAGMTYISYANTCAAMVRNCLKEPHKIKALNREQVYDKLQIYQEGEAHKAGACSSFLTSPPQNHKPLLLLFFFSSASLWQVA